MPLLTIGAQHPVRPPYYNGVIVSFKTNPNIITLAEAIAMRAKMAVMMLTIADAGRLRRLGRCR